MEAVLARAVAIAVATALMSLMSRARGAARRRSSVSRGDLRAAPERLVLQLAAAERGAVVCARGWA